MIYNNFLLIVLCSIWAFSQNEEKPEVIYVPYADTISQELVDYIRSRTKPYILSYHSDMKHLIPEMRCRIQRGKRIGVFSVAKDRQVSFSQGNLQYHRKRYEWKFADNQWDYLEDKNLDGNYIDLFDWTTDSIGGFLDWGTYDIQGDFPDTWRTLKIDEWKYLFHDRPRATELLGGAKVEEVMGIVVLPDDWQCPERLNFISVFQEDYTWDDDLKLYVFHEDIYSHNIFTSATWSLMEQAGAVFLPTSGYINGSGKLMSCGSVARMWSSTSHNYSKGYYISFGFANNSRTLRTYSNVNNDLGHSVRLVHDTILPPPAPCETFEVNGVKFNMMCVEGGTFMMGVGSDAHQVTLSDYKIAQTELTQELWEAVMGKSYDVIFASNYPDLVYKGANYPAYALTWYDCQEFITRLNQLTGLDFRLPTEAEWEYAARGGNRSRGFKYSGSDNLDEVAWYAFNSDNHMYPIAQKKPNELGIYDMTGNAWELCLDGYETYSTYPQTNPLTPVKNEVVARGGSSYKGWNEDNCLITHRLNRTPNAVRTRNTLRLVLSDEVKVKTIVLDKKQIFNMVYVEGGTFMMGSNQDIAPANARPAHSVTLSDFFIAQTEVTNELWQTVMSSQVNKKSDSPVGNVTWEECQIFTQQLSQLTGLHFRLPTEAEWEYAARGGQKSRGYLYSGSNEPDYIGWLNNMSTGIQPVAQKMPNELGIYDMTGNSWEWCQDGGLRIYKDAVCNPMYDGVSTGHVIRGGSFRTVPERCSNIARSTYGSNKGDSHISMRLVMDAHDYVDLGFSVMWATCNVGATAPEEYGDYFAWGEIESKDVYDWATYKWCDGTEQNITKYNAEDGLTTLLLEDDAAHANWGGEWRMATEIEWSELCEQCTWKWTTLNGVNGYRVISKINGNSIFVPAGGYRSGSSYLNSGEKGQFWTSFATGINAKAIRFGADENPKKVVDFRRCGENIRPVLPTDREPLPSIVPSKRIGVFSVAKDKQVSFSQGNLQYVQSLNHWRFADNQYDYIGEENLKNGQLADRIDLFGWSGDNTTAPFGVSTSIVNTDYSGDFVDWGVNEISGDAPNTWRTLSKDEWEYLLNERENAKTLRCRAEVDGVNGFVFLPDNWICPEGIELNLEDFNLKVFTIEQWHVLENAGAVFLPAEGRRQGTNLINFNDHGNYWSSIRKNSDYVEYFAFTFSTDKLYVDAQLEINLGRSVRLVHDTILPPPAPCRTIEVNGVTFNMMCVDGEEYDYFVGQTEVTCSQWKAVMGSLPKGHTVGNKPIYNVTWGECQEFITKLNELTGLYFRFPTKDEWLYAAKGGQYKDDYLYSGSDDINQVGWYSDNSVGTRAHDVAKLKPNSLGIYDMTGNVWEWVESADGKHLYMGGSYAFKAESCLLSKTQGFASNDNHIGSIGIRLVLVINK